MNAINPKVFRPVCNRLTVIESAANFLCEAINVLLLGFIAMNADRHLAAFVAIHHLCLLDSEDSNRKTFIASLAPAAGFTASIKVIAVQLPLRPARFAHFLLQFLALYINNRQIKILDRELTFM